MSSNRTAGNRHGSAVITLTSDTDVLITRAFDAPAALVFKAYTTPELVRRWWGLDSSEWVVCEIDLRVGGTWRFVIRDGGVEVGFHGEYREIQAPTRLVATEVYEGLPAEYTDATAINNITFDEADGVTTMSLLVEMPSQEARDAMLASGMESGMQLSYDRLEDLVREGV
jgi:uncharacterized protein YndB with AHSA1/START domain